MMQVALKMRFVLLVASIGAAVGALVMFWIGGEKIFAAVHALVGAHDKKAAIAGVMGATDAFLFGVVLVIFAYGIAFGFVLDMPASVLEALPHWMRVHSLAELEHRLIDVIILYMIVDYASDWAEGPNDAGWLMLVKPVAIVLIAASARLMASTHAGRDGNKQS